MPRYAKMQQPEHQDEGHNVHRLTQAITRNLERSQTTFSARVFPATEDSNSEMGLHSQHKAHSNRLLERALITELEQAMHETRHPAKIATSLETNRYQMVDPD